jgi:DNA-binding FrmR family transcriptional regulator
MVWTMSHVIDQRKQLLARVNRLLGQMTALKREIENAGSDEECGAIMQQIASIRGAMNGLSMLYLEEHVRKHIARGQTAFDRERAADDLLAALKSFRA